MASATEQLIMRIALVDAITRPLQGINNQLKTVKNTAQSGFASIAGGGAAMLAGGMAIQNALMPAIEMDRALGEVASLDVAQSGLKALSDEALKFSVEYGKSATEFVRASYDIQSAIGGLSESELPAFTRASAVLAAATKADTGTITSYMGTMYGIFEQQAVAMGKADWVEAVAGKTATAVQMFKTTGQGMADAFQGVQSTATSLGVSMDEQFAVLGMLQSTMGGAVAGTAYKSFLSAIPKAGKGLGLSFYDASGAMLPMVDILEQIKGKFGDLEGEDIGKISAAFGETATPVILNLLEKTDQLKGNINALGSTTGMGKAEKMAADMTDQWQRVESAWFAIRAAAFGAVLPTINKVVGVFADGGALVLRWTRLFPHLTKVISYTMLAIAGLGVVTGAWMVLAGIAKLVTLAWALTLGRLKIASLLARMGTILSTAAMVVWVIVCVLAKITAFAFTAALWAVSAVLWVVKLALGIGAWLAWAAVVLLSKMTIFSFNAALVVLRGTLTLLRGVMLAVNAVMLANPVILIVMGIIALIAAIVLGIYYWDEIKAAMADMGVFELMTAAIDGLKAGWASFMDFMSNLSPFQLLGNAVDWLIDKLNMIPGVNIEMGSTPALALPNAGGINAPLSSYRQQNQSKVPAGGLGQQLIQANAVATSANQKPSRSLTTGDVYMNVQNPLSPGELEQELWMTTRG
ncbi:phage tail tape measure protein [Aeromonas hydrophila]|uniref:phage tail tape measure protein n=1 Tax=Aeromonas hydrophila TaxID=644 RepID=UPI001CC5EEBF|nr:phage tail tape measure protein [Aeromonas hydrophila]GJC03942.1 phage tail tape measure protein [Aeromonas hydrophila]